MVIALLVWVVLFGLCIAYFRQDARRPDIEGPVLIVTAHPDDECMFFSPVILSLIKWGVPVDLLCLSSGNYYGTGRVRCAELKHSINVLGIRHHRVICDTRLPDHPRKNWSTDAINQYIYKSARRWHSKAIISFDGYGVSGHSNHCRIHHALAEKSHGSPNIVVYSLKTYGIILKYCAPLTIISTFLMLQKFTFLVPLSSTFVPHRAMLQHRSQLLWFRYLYIIFASYMYINVLSPLRNMEV